MIKYLGSKRVLVPAITDAVEAFPGVRSVLDLFSGTSRVGAALKERDFRVIANDHNAYAHCLATCYVQADAEDVALRAEKLLAELNRLPGRPGYFTETFCERSRYVHPSNGERIDAAREQIAVWGLDPELEAVLLTALVVAADRVDSTTGVQMAYLKDWSDRAQTRIELRLPPLLPRARWGKAAAHRLDAFDAATMDADVAYVDPPYNQHSYLGNYHVWESLVLWDKPEVYGVACKRLDCRERRSVFNFKRDFRDSMERLLLSIAAPRLVVSFSNEGYMTPDDMRAILEKRGEVAVIERPYRRYIGAAIGIHDLNGKVVGKPGPKHNKEFLFVCADRIPEALQCAEPARR